MLSGACALTIALALQAASPAPPAPKPGRPVAELFTGLGHDVRALASGATAIIGGVGGGAAILVRPFDDNLANWALGRGPSTYTKFGSVSGNGWVQVSAAVATYAIGLASNAPAATRVGSDLIRGQLLTGIITQGLKVGVGRTRPTGGPYSFPSGHASASFVTAAVLQGDLGLKAGIPAYAAGGFIAWTRVRQRAHWLTDVVIGSTIGTVVGHAVTSGHRARPWTIVPAATANEVSVYVIKRR